MPFPSDSDTRNPELASTPVRSSSAPISFPSETEPYIDVQIDLTDNCIEDDNSPQLTSTLAIALQRVLGDNQDVVKFNDLHEIQLLIERKPDTKKF